MHVGVVGGDAVGDLLEDGRLAGLGRRDDQAALAAADGRDQVDQALGEVVGGGLQVEHLAGEDGRQVVEVGPPLGDLRIEAVDRLDAQQAEVLLALLGRAHLAGDHVARAQAEAANLRLGDVDVVGAGQEALLAQEAEAVLDDLQHAAAEDVALLLGLGLQQAKDEVLLAQGAVAGDT